MVLDYEAAQRLKTEIESALESPPKAWAKALADHNVAIAQRGSIFEIVIEHAAGFEPSERQFELLADHLRSHADAETNVLFEVTPVILRPRVAA